MASFLLPDRPTTPSGTAVRRSLLTLLASGDDKVERAEDDMGGQTDDDEGEDEIHSLADFSDLALGQ